MTQHTNNIQRKNEVLQRLIFDCIEASREHDAPVWRTVANTLSSPTRDHPTVNLSDLNNVTTDEIIVVPGKVLGGGVLTQDDITVAAHKFSSSAKQRINEDGDAYTLRQLLNDNPEGSNIRIIS